MPNVKAGKYDSSHAFAQVFAVETIDVLAHILTKHWKSKSKTFHGMGVPTSILALLWWAAKWFKGAHDAIPECKEDAVVDVVAAIFVMRCMISGMN